MVCRWLGACFEARWKRHSAWLCHQPANLIKKGEKRCVAAPKHTPGAPLCAIFRATMALFRLVFVSLHRTGCAPESWSRLHLCSPALSLHGGMAGMVNSVALSQAVFSVHRRWRLAGAGCHGVFLLLRCVMLFHSTCALCQLPGFQRFCWACALTFRNRRYGRAKQPVLLCETGRFKV